MKIFFLLIKNTYLSIYQNLAKIHSSYANDIKLSLNKVKVLNYYGKNIIKPSCSKVKRAVYIFFFITAAIGCGTRHAQKQMRLVKMTFGDNSNTH